MELRRPIQRRRARLLNLVALMTLTVLLAGCDGTNTPTPKSPQSSAVPNAPGTPSPLVLQERFGVTAAGQ